MDLGCEPGSLSDVSASSHTGGTCERHLERQQGWRIPPNRGRAIQLVALAFPIVALAHGVYAVPGDTARGSEGRANAGFVVTDSGVIAIDAGGSPYQAKRMVASIRTVTPAPV